jgi:hypothetical protein
MLKEILYCDLLINTGKKHEWLKSVVYKETDGFYHNKALYKNPVKVLEIIKIKSLGFEAFEQI